MSQSDLQALVASWARPLFERVEGSPFQPADRVKVVDIADSTADPRNVGKTGCVVFLEYDCGCGQQFPNDPMIGVRFDDGSGESEFWAEELALL